MGDALPAAVALGDLGDDEAGKGVEEGGGEEDDRQGDAVHRAEDGEGGARREPARLKPDGDEQVFDGGEPRAQVGAHRHGQRDAEQPSGQAVFGRALPAEAPAVPEVEDQRTHEGEPLGDHARAGDGEAGVFKAGRHQEGEADDREADLQKLLEDLRGGGFGHPSDGGKVTVQRAGHRDEGHRERHGLEGTDGLDAAEAGLPDEGRGEKEEEGCRAAKEQRVAEAAAHRALDVAVGAGGLLRDEPRRREVDARRREGDGEGIDRHDELEDAHPLRADLTGDIEVEPDAHGVHEQRGRGHDHGVEEKTLYFFHSFTTDLFDNKVYEKTAAKSPTQPFPF